MRETPFAIDGVPRLGRTQSARYLVLSSVELLHTPSRPTVQHGCNQCGDTTEPPPRQHQGSDASRHLRPRKTTWHSAYPTPHRGLTCRCYPRMARDEHYPGETTYSTNPDVGCKRRIYVVFRQWPCFRALSRHRS